MTRHVVLPSLRRHSIRLCCSALALAGAVTAATAQVATAAAAALRAGIRLDSTEVAAAESGEVVVRTLPTQNQRDVAVFGIVRLAAPRDVYLRRVQDFRQWLRTPTRARLGIFSDPPVPADVAEVVVAKDDAEDLEDCRPGKCSTKLSAAEMQRVEAAVDWSSPEWYARVTALVRQHLAHLAREYHDRGNAAMPVYDDRPSVRASDAFLTVLTQSQFLSQAAPEVVGYFRAYPNDRPAGLADVIYWSEDVVARLRPILGITHLLVYTPSTVAGTTVIASKQIYANHYFEAALEVVNAIDREAAADPPATYVVVERRFRFDNLPRGGILNIRGRAVNGVRQQLLADLRREKVATERAASRAR